MVGRVDLYRLSTGSLQVVRLTLGSQVKNDHQKRTRA